MCCAERCPEALICRQRLSRLGFAMREPVSAEELEMSSRLQSNRITPTAKVGTLILLAIFHTFQTGLVLSTKSTIPLLLIISGLRTRAVSKASRANRPI